MRVSISPCRLCGSISAPPSKSYAHRMLICGALSTGESLIHGISNSEDMLATLDCVRALGVRAQREGDGVRLSGALPESLHGEVFPCRESGSTLRFFIPIALAVGGSFSFTGTRRLMERGVGIYEELFSKRGVCIEKFPEELRFTGKLTPGEYSLWGDVSSQFVSGLLFALPLLEGESEIKVLPPVESRRYIDITADAMGAFGVEIKEPEENRFLVRGSQSYTPGELGVEGDWSNAAALYGLNALGHELEIDGLNAASLQGDRVCLDIFEQLEQEGAGIDLSGCPDLGPVAFAVAAAKKGARFTGTRRLRIKESDRAAAMSLELSKFGVRTELEENSVTVYGGGLRAPEEALDSHNDHRIVMALTLLSTLTGGRINGAEAIRKSYPDFFEELERVGLETEYEA